MLFGWVVRFIFFFFQAEDGIRDLTVTGVQTCALPISFDEFTSGDFEFDANVGAVAITAAATGTAGTTGASVSASGGKRDAITAGKHYKGMAVFTIVKGGAMYEISVAGAEVLLKAGESVTP